MREKYYKKALDIMNEVKKVIIGKDEIIKKVLLAILSEGHILIEDIPGVGKTTLVLGFTKAMSLDYKRMQFTPDVLPSDITGFYIYNKAKEEFEYKRGVAYCNLLLADEINRTSSKTQSALLEVMEEGKITVDGITHNVPKPFTVIATQNPIGAIGTHLLPEAQLDRFMIRISMGYPDINSEIEIAKGKSKLNPMDTIVPVVTKEDILKMADIVSDIYVSDEIYSYIANLVVQTRNNQFIELGISPRGTQSIVAISKAVAFLENRDYVIPDDVLFIIKDVFMHRILLNSKARLKHLSIENLIDEIIQNVKMP